MTEKRKLYERDRIILKTGLIGILVNFVLAGIKVLIGLLGFDRNNTGWCQ